MKEVIRQISIRNSINYAIRQRDAYVKSDSTIFKMMLMTEMVQSANMLGNLLENKV